MALYGPLLDRYGRDKGQYKHKEYHVTPEGGLLTGPQLVLALAERGKKWQWGPGGINEFSRERWRIEPWLEYHGLDEGELEQILPGLFYASSKITLETLAGSTRPGEGRGESRRNREDAKASLQVLSTRVEEECDSPQRPSQGVQRSRGHAGGEICAC